MSIGAHLVFVFDGTATHLKKETLEARQKNGQSSSETDHCARQKFSKLLQKVQLY